MQYIKPMLEVEILKVSQLNSLTKKLLEKHCPQVLVAGEISNLIKHSSGHIYFSLKDELAQVRAVMFRRYNMAIKFEPQNGMHVIVTAQVSLYETRGDYQLIVEQMEPAGKGALHARFLQLKAKLAAEGLFATHTKKTLPKIPRAIGVITSPTGAVISDILRVLQRRFASIPVIIYPVLVQGNEAAEQIVRALQTANLRGECDVLIIARGGGSLEDLWPFNEEIVARAIFASRIPTISAIGHETDFTISDFVADVRAPTPSVAAELAAPNHLEWQQLLLNYRQRMVRNIQHYLTQYTMLITSLHKRLHHPRYYLAANAQRLDSLEHRLRIAIQHKISYSKQHLTKVGSALDAISPLATLARGYAIATKGTEIIHAIQAVKAGEQIQIRITDGVLHCLIENIQST